jgi:lauroyl/myristoyl acyltransferase
MASPLQQLRRATTQLAIRQAITATASLPVGLQRSIVDSVVSFAGRIPVLRRRVRENMNLALGRNVSVETAELYYRHVGWVLSNSLSVFHYGIGATPVPAEVKFDESIRLLDDAAAQGRGVVLASGHWSGHELVAAIINRRHPMALIVRPAATSERAARKMKWYNALGTEIVLRSNGASTIKDAVAYLNVLKKGKLLAITPDLLADSGQGIEARIFERPARFHGGAFALATAAKAPMIRLSLRWQSESSVVAMFDCAPQIFDSSDRDATIRAGVQDWCRWFEDKLRANPENWLFWLDKRWSRFLRETPRTAGAE